MIGSRRRWLTTVKGLKAKGVSEEKIAQVHSPMGLELNAETPEEIAVSRLRAGAGVVAGDPGERSSRPRLFTDS